MFKKGLSSLGVLLIFK